MMGKIELRGYAITTTAMEILENQSNYINRINTLVLVYNFT
jgi:hypothetical protein